MEIIPPPPTTLCTPPPICSAAPQTPPSELDQADFLAIDDLLDFSNEEIGGPIDPFPSIATSCQLKLEAAASLTFDRKLSSQPCAFDSDSLCLPYDDLAELEWLSNFVEESFSSRDPPACLRDFAAYTGLCNDDNASHCRSSDESFRTTSPVSVLEANAFPSEKNCPTFSFGPDILSVPGRARSKRCRTAVCFWNTRILCAEVSESLLETAPTTCGFRTGSSESDVYSSYYDYDDENEDEGRANDGADDDGLFYGHRPNQRVKYFSMKLKNSSYRKEKSSNKHLRTKPKKMKVEESPPIRKCLHCGTQKTPQWRAGPMGPKTLCNACGVRYKSGRLCEEYRPAASPTFTESVHSNSHRKVLEMRRQRGETGNGNGNGNGNGSYRPRDNGHRLNCATSGVSSDAGAAINRDGYAPLALENKEEDRSGE